MNFKFTNASLAYTINAGYIVLVVLLIGVGVISFMSISVMTSGMSDLSQGMSEMGTDLQKAMREMDTLDENVAVLMKSEEEFSRLREMQASLEKSRKNTAMVGSELDSIKGIFSGQNDSLIKVSEAVGTISEQIRIFSGTTQQLISAAGEINARMLNSYIGFFNYLNEFTPGVDEPLADIEAIDGHCTEIITLLESMNDSGKGLELVAAIQHDLRRYQRYMRDLGRTTSTTQIAELKTPLVEYGNKIIRTSSLLKEYAWNIANQNNAIAIARAEQAEKSGTEALEAGRASAGIIGQSIELAQSSSQQIGELTSSLSSALAGIDKGLAEIPRAVNQVAGAMKTVNKSLGIMEKTVQTSRSLETLAGRARIIVVLVCIGAVAVGLLLGLYVNRKIVRPLSRFTRGLHRAAQNDLTVRIDPAGTSGELKDLIKEVNTLIKTFADNVDRMKRMSFQVHDNASHLNSIAGDTSSALDNQNDMAAQIAAVAVEMSDSSHHVAVNSGEARKQAQQVAEQLIKGESVIQEMLVLSESISSALVTASTQINSLVNDSEKINDIIATINSIARQTNMLALNATIEAARAGQHGKGFAVVANEVKQLAGQTAKATLDIAELLESVQKRISLSVTDIQSCGEQSDLEGKKSVEVISHLAEIKESITVLKNQIAAIASATEEQEKSVLTVACTIETISGITQDTFAKMNGIVSQGEDLVGAAENLLESISVYDKNTPQTGLQETVSKSANRQLPPPA